MKGIIITGGEAPERKYIEHEIADSVFIIAADSGLETAVSYGYKPDLIVGDMDSIKNLKILNDFPRDCVRIFPKEKDETDTEIALRMMFEKNVDEVVLLGGGGGRLDHLLGIVSIFDREYYPAVWYTAHDRIESIDGKKIFFGMKGKEVSFFPVGNELCRMKSSGLKWPLNEMKWVKGHAGISNIVLTDPFKIEMESGRLIMISQL